MRATGGSGPNSSHSRPLLSRAIAALSGFMLPTAAANERLTATTRLRSGSWSIPQIDSRA